MGSILLTYPQAGEGGSADLRVCVASLPARTLSESGDGRVALKKECDQGLCAAPVHGLRQVEAGIFDARPAGGQVGGLRTW